LAQAIWLKLLQLEPLVLPIEPRRSSSCGARVMWKLWLASLLAASASGLRGRGLMYKSGGHPHETATAPQKTAAPPNATAAKATAATCSPFPGQQVVLVTANKDFMPFFQNWLSFAGSFLTSFEQVVVIAEDAEVVPMLRSFLHKGARTPFKIVIPDNATVSGFPRTALLGIQDTHPIDSKAYKKLVTQRPSRLRHFLEQNCTVLYADIDTAWLKNPFDAISRAGDYEMYVTDDLKNGHTGLNSPYLCSCFLYMHPTSNVKAVISLWESMLKGKTDYDQPFFNKAFQKIRHRSPGFAVALPRKEFPPGCDVPDHPTVLHANWIIGEQNKTKFLKEHGAWSLH